MTALFGRGLRTIPETLNDNYAVEAVNANDARWELGLSESSALDTRAPLEARSEGKEMCGCVYHIVRALTWHDSLTH